MGGEPWLHPGRRTKSGIVQHVGMFPHGARCILRIRLLCRPVADWRYVLFVGVGADQAGIDSEAFTADRSLPDATPDDTLKHLSEDIALAEPTVAVPREGRVIRDRIGQVKAAKPPICQIGMYLVTQAALRTDTHAIAGNQHPDRQFRADGGTTGGTVEGAETGADARTDRQSGQSTAKHDQRERDPQARTRKMN